MSNVFRVLIALGLSIGVAQTVQAGFLANIYVSGADNLFEDQDRDALVDVDGSGTFSVGDILLGFARMDDHTAPAGAFGPLGNRVYGVFSQQVVDINTTGATHEIIFDATTTVGLRLTDLLPGLGIPTEAIFAAFDRTTPFPTELINVSPGDENLNGTINMLDYIAEIQANGSLSFAAGIGNVGGAVNTTAIDAPVPLAGFLALPDHFIARTTPTGSLLITTPGSLAGLPGLGLGVTIANFEAGLTVLLNNEPAVTYNTVVAATETGGGLLGIFHDVSITGGTVHGSSGAVNAAEWGSTSPEFPNPGGFTTDADFVVNVTVIPEPSSLALFSLGLVALGGVRALRRRKSSAT